MFCELRTEDVERHRVMTRWRSESEYREGKRNEGKELHSCVLSTCSGQVKKSSRGSEGVFILSPPFLPRFDPTSPHDVI